MNPMNIITIEPDTPAFQFVQVAAQENKPLRLHLEDDGRFVIKFGYGMWSPPYENGPPQ